MGAIRQHAGPRAHVLRIPHSLINTTPVGPADIMDEKTIEALTACIPPGVIPSRPGDPATETFRVFMLVGSQGEPIEIGVPSNPRRGQGRTLLQMLESPKGAVFVWPSPRSLWYPSRMQAAIQRPDLRVIHAGELARPEFARNNAAQVVIDHAVWELNGLIWHQIRSSLDILMSRGLCKFPD